MHPLCNLDAYDGVTLKPRGPRHVRLFLFTPEEERAITRACRLAFIFMQSYGHPRP